MIPRNLLSVAVVVVVGGWALLLPASAEAGSGAAGNEKFHEFLSARQTQELSPDLGFGQLPLPLPRGQVRRIEARLPYRRPLPRIPRSLRRNPFSERANLQRATTLEVLRELALRRPSHIAGGLYFSPPNGTPYFPVRPINALNYLPIFRVLHLV